MPIENKLNQILKEFSLLRGDISAQDESNHNRISSLEEQVVELKDALQQIYKFQVEQNKKYGGK